MGVDVYSYLVVGIELAEHTSIRMKEQEITKYNENTGKPYKKTISEKMYVLGNQEFTEDEWKELPAQLEPRLGDLQFFSTCSETENELLGISIARTDSHRSGQDYVEVEKNEVDEAIEKAQTQLRQLGINDEVKIYLVPYVSV